MKGQVLASLKAVESIVKNGGLPVNVKWLIEGEEEIGQTTWMISSKITKNYSAAISA